MRPKSEIEADLVVVRRRQRMIDAMEMADLHAGREDYNYDPYGDGAIELFDKRMKLYALQRELVTELEQASNTISG